MDQRERRDHPFLARVSDLLPGVTLIGAAILTSVLMLTSASRRPLTDLEQTLFQVLSLGLGLIGSFLVGRRSAELAAQDVIRPHAKSAFRRLLSLYQALGRLQASVQGRREVLRRLSLDLENGTTIDIEHVESTLDLLWTQVTEQLGTANDAMEDWRDLVPEEVAELEEKALIGARDVDGAAQTGEVDGEAG